MDLVNDETHKPPSAHPRLETLRAVFFDFGDTLVSLSPAKEELFVEAARSVGLALSLAAVKRAYQIVDFHHKYSSVHLKDRAGFYRSYNQQLCEAMGISSHFNELQPELVAHFRDNKRWQSLEDVPQILSRIQQSGIPLGLIANWNRDLPGLAEQLGVRQFFATIVSSQEAGVEKPDPAIFERALGDLALSVENETVLYVGNEYSADVLGARGAGLTPVLIDRNGLYPHADCLCYGSLLQWSMAMF